MPTEIQNNKESRRFNLLFRTIQNHLSLLKDGFDESDAAFLNQI